MLDSIVQILNTVLSSNHIRPSGTRSALLRSAGMILISGVSIPRLKKANRRSIFCLTL